MINLKYRLFKDKRIGIIKIDGIILDTGPLPVATKIVDSFKTARKLNIKNIVLRINSPGGTVGASQEIYREIKKLQEDDVKIVASLGDVAASGGLYVAVGADKIVSNPGTVTGSIGVIIKTNVLKGLYKKIGIDSQIVKSGKYKDILSPTKYLSKEEKEILQELIDSTYEQFVETIAENQMYVMENVPKYNSTEYKEKWNEIKNNVRKEVENGNLFENEENWMGFSPSTTLVVKCKKSGKELDIAGLFHHDGGRDG